MTNKTKEMEKSMKRIRILGQKLRDSVPSLTYYKIYKRENQKGK